SAGCAPSTSSIIRCSPAPTRQWRPASRIWTASRARSRIPITGPSAASIRPIKPQSSARLHLKESARGAVQALDAVVRDEHHFAGLYAGAAVLADDVGLDHDGHAGPERLLGNRPGRATRRAEDRRQVTAAVAVQEIVAGGETRVLDH